MGESDPSLTTGVSKQPLQHTGISELAEVHSQELQELRGQRLASLWRGLRRLLRSDVLSWVLEVAKNE